MSVQDLILKAGGLLESASTVRIDVSRRIKDPKSVSSSTVIGKSFTVELKNGLLIGESNTLKLEPMIWCLYVEVQGIKSRQM